MIPYKVTFKSITTDIVDSVLVYESDKEFAHDQVLFNIKNNRLGFGPVEILSVEEDDDYILYNLL